MKRPTRRRATPAAEPGDEDVPPSRKAPPGAFSIDLHLSCMLCRREAAEIGIAPRDRQDIDVGMTRWGLQVWCRRHACNILHVDFRHGRFPATLQPFQPSHPRGDFSIVN